MPVVALKELRGLRWRKATPRVTLGQFAPAQDANGHKKHHGSPAYRRIGYCHPDLPPDPEGLAEFYDRAGPGTDPDKTLVAAYWNQHKQSQTEVEAQHINKQLKHLGRGVGNITRAFEGLRNAKSALKVQLRKEGTTKRARKKYKLTAEGGG